LGARRQLPDADSDQIRAERRGLGELHRPATAGLLLVLDGGAVGERDDAFGQADELEAPARLERRLVEAGKDAAGVGGLELRHRQGSRAAEAPPTGAALAGPG